MSSLTPPDFITATKEQLETQQALWSELTSKTFESVRMLVDLNMQMMKDTVADSTAVTQQLVSARTPQEFISRTSALTQPNLEKVLAYGRDVAAITGSIQAQLQKAAQSQIAENKDKVSARALALSQATPDHAGKTLAMMQSALEKTNGGYEQWVKATQQAVEVMQANLAMAANQFTAAADKAAGKGRN